MIDILHLIEDLIPPSLTEEIYSHCQSKTKVPLNRLRRDGLSEVFIIRLLVLNNKCKGCDIPAMELTIENYLQKLTILEKELMGISDAT